MNPKLREGVPVKRKPMMWKPELQAAIAVALLGLSPGAPRAAEPQAVAPPHSMGRADQGQVLAAAAVPAAPLAEQEPAPCPEYQVAINGGCYFETLAPKPCPSGPYYFEHKGVCYGAVMKETPFSCGPLQVAINGGCWFKIVPKAPCPPDYYRHKDGCYAPVMLPPVRRSASLDVQRATPAFAASTHRAPRPPGS